MRHRLLCFALIATLAAAPVFATPARQQSLGGLADAFEDDASVPRWPASLTDYVNEGYLALRAEEHGGPSSFGGAYIGFDEAGRWGALGLVFADRLPESEPGGYFTAIYARGFGPVTAAVAFRGTTYGEARNESGAGEFHSDARYLHDWGLGLRADLSDRLYLDAAAEVVRSEIEYQDDAIGIRVHENDADSHAWRLRAFAQVTDRVVLVPHVAYDHDVRPTLSDALQTVADYSAWQLQTGLGVNVMLDPDNLVLLSGEYLSLQRDWAARYPDVAAFDTGWRDIWQVLIRVGYETRVLPWLSLRAGVVYRRHTDESYLLENLPTDYADIDYRWRVKVDIPASVGLGLHFGALDGDVSVHDASLLSAENLPAGVREQSDGVAVTGTLRYAF